MKGYSLVILLIVAPLLKVLGQNSDQRTLGALIEYGHLRSTSNSIYVSPGAGRLRVIILKNLEDFSLGAGFGLDGYSYYNTAPLFLDIRLSKYDKFTPFICLGNAMKLGPLFESGPMINAGITTNLIPRKEWLKGSISYNYQKLNKVTFNEVDVNQSSVAFGLVFSPWN